MKRFTYKAKEQGSSKVIKGTIQAESERAAGKLLMDRGYIPESIRDEADGMMKSKKVSANARITFTRSFATLIGAGLPLAQSLRTVAEQTDDAPMKALIEEYLAMPEDLTDPIQTAKKKEKWRVLVASLPSGFCLGATMVTNYQQLKTMYHQRRFHKLQEWHDFCDWCDTLPHFQELTHAADY